MCLSTFLDIIATGFLLVTLIVISIYTYQTYKLRQETTRQTELSQRPFVMIFETDLNKIKYKNSGQGIALNISIKPFEDQGYTFFFEKENLLSPNEVSKHDINPVPKDKKTGEIFPPGTKIPFTPSELRSTTLNVVRIIEIQYENIEQKRYQTLVKISREGIEYKGTKEVKT